MLSDELYDLAWFALVTFVLSFVSLVVSICIIRVTIIDIKQSSMANTTSPAIYLFFISRSTASEIQTNIRTIFITTSPKSRKDNDRETERNEFV